MKINSIECPRCHDVIWSRADHDFRECSCGEVYIDGGFSYTRVGWKIEKPEMKEIDLDISKEECYVDWNKHIDKLGLIKNI